MNRENRKFIELYYIITHNGNVIPYEDEMEPVIQKTSGYSFYIKNWEDYMGRMHTKLGEGFDEWLENLKTMEDFIRNDESFARNFPSKQIEISWGNEMDLAIEIKKIYEHYLSQVRRYCKPVVNSGITAYYEIGPGGYTMQLYSYEESDVKMYKKKVADIFTAARDEVYAAVNRFNKAQGIGKNTDNILLKQPSFSNSSGVKTGDDEGGRGHMVDDDTVFEYSLFIDEYHAYREGKGNVVEDKDLIRLFGAIPQEFEGVGDDI